MCVYTHSGILFSRKREGNPAIVTTWRSLEDTMLGEMSQTETNTVWLHLCVNVEKLDVCNHIENL